MGLFNAYKAVNRANHLLKEMEVQLDFLYNKLASGCSFQQIRLEWNVLKEQFIELQEVQLLHHTDLKEDKLPQGNSFHS